MRVQMRIVVLLFVIISVFFALLIFQKMFEKNRLILLFKDEESHINETFDRIIELKGRSLKTLSIDYTYWDEMVDFAKNGDNNWAKENIDTALPTFSSNTVWVYKTDLTPVYFVSNIEGSETEKSLFSAVQIPQLFSKGPFAHFFIYSDKGLYEIRGAVIQPTSDIERKTPAQGYFFAGRLWNREYIQDLSVLCKSNIEIKPVSENPHPFYISNPEIGVFSLARVLNDWKGAPLARITAWQSSKMIQNFNRSFNQFFLALFFCFGSFLAVFIFLLLRWIKRPLQLISRALETESPVFLDFLQKDKTEFGDISRTIAVFFEQKEELLVEMDRRQEAEEDLIKLNSSLEFRIKERTKALEGANKELKAAYNELQEAQKEVIQSEKLAAIGLMASGIAHEIKNPMAIIIQGTEYLRAQPACTALSEEITMIENAALRADKIIKGLLDFSRQAPLIFEEVDCASVIEESLVLTQHQLALGNISVVKRLTPGLPKIKADSNQLKQVFINILINASEAMPQGGMLTISLDKIANQAEKEYLQIIFTDTGCGIPEENLRKIFEPFFSTKKNPGSAGLGLSIIQRIIERHKGSIEVKSKVGTGTSMIINLPVD